MSGEKRGVRDSIDRFTEHLIKHDPKLANDKARARKIATDAARRVEHGESIHTEGRKPQK